MNGVSSYQHAALIGVASGGEEGVPRDALLANGDLIQRCAFGQGPISLLIERGMTKAKAEKTMRDPRQAREAFASFFAHTVEQLIKDGRIIDTDGVLTLGTMPRGYNPVQQETKERRSTSLMNLVSVRRKAGGWTYYTNPELDEGAVARLAESMSREGWPKGHTVLLDADGNVADGKHHIAAADIAGIDWHPHAVTITDEIELWQEVKTRNLDRWHGSKAAVAKRYAEFLALRPDLSVGEKLTAMRERMAGASKRTQQRATAATKKQTKAERDAAIKAALAEGKSQREVAEELGVAKSTVADISKQGEAVPENRQDGANRAAEPEPGPEVIDTCCICKTPITEGEKVDEIIVPAEGFRIGVERRKGGGGNAVRGVYVKTGELAHHDCMPRNTQIAYRGR